VAKTEANGLVSTSFEILVWTKIVTTWIYYHFFYTRYAGLPWTSRPKRRKYGFKYGWNGGCCEKSLPGNDRRWAILVWLIQYFMSLCTKFILSWNTVLLQTNHSSGAWMRHGRRKQSSQQCFVSSHEGQISNIRDIFNWSNIIDVWIPCLGVFESKACGMNCRRAFVCISVCQFIFLLSAAAVH